MDLCFSSEKVVSTIGINRASERDLRKPTEQMVSRSSMGVDMLLIGDVFFLRGIGDVNVTYCLLSSEFIDDHLGVSSSQSYTIQSYFDHFAGEVHFLWSRRPHIDLSSLKQEALSTSVSLALVNGSVLTDVCVVFLKILCWILYFSPSSKMIL
jgi:hypothetical protein